MSVSFLNYGGIITKIITPDQNGKLENIVLSYENYNEYKDNPNCFGAIIGRVAGKIDNAQFNLNGQEYNLQKMKKITSFMAERLLFTIHSGKLLPFTKKLVSASN